MKSFNKYIVAAALLVLPFSAMADYTSETQGGSDSSQVDFSLTSESTVALDVSGTGGTTLAAGSGGAEGEVDFGTFNTVSCGTSNGACVRTNADNGSVVSAQLTLEGRVATFATYDIDIYRSDAISGEIVSNRMYTGASGADWSDPGAQTQISENVGSQTKIVDDQTTAQADVIEVGILVLDTDAAMTAEAVQLTFTITGNV